ncbi:uncharacterized protein TNCV_437801 [Trichonephila clavipes]|nr:uncharacterized protein TNCV_437801 [Trichonephila clavipes]
MLEALNTTSLSICNTMCESGHLLTQSIRNVLSCCKPPTTYWFLNLGNQIKVTVTFHRIYPSKNGYFDVMGGAYIRVRAHGLLLRRGPGPQEVLRRPCKHPCLPRDVNPDPTAQQSLSLQYF